MNPNGSSSMVQDGNLHRKPGKGAAVFRRQGNCP